MISFYQITSKPIHSSVATHEQVVVGTLEQALGFADLEAYNYNLDTISVIELDDQYTGLVTNIANKDYS